MRLRDLLEYIDVDKTVLQMGDKLKQRFAQDQTIDDNYDPTEFIKYVSDDVDPTKNQQYSLWILRTYMKSGISSSEDLSRTNIALKKFIQTKSQLSIKDIGQIKSLSGLESLVDSVEPQQSGKEQKRQLSGEMKQQTTVYYRGPEGMILIPKTEEASCFWGQGTKWCTASTTADNQFISYNNNGPLYVIMPKDGTKWQFHLYTGSFMDAKNEPVDARKFMAKYPWVFKKIKFSEAEQISAVKNNTNALEYLLVAGIKPSEEVQLTAVQQNGYAIKLIIGVGIKPSEEVQMAAVQQRDLVIQYIINAGIKPSEEVQIIAVQRSCGYSLTYSLAAGIKPSEEILMTAVQNDKYGYAIKNILNAGIKPSDEVLMTAVQNDKYGYAIKNILNAGIKPSEDVQIAAVQSNEYAIKSIMDAGIRPSEEVQIAAVQNDRDGDVIRHIIKAGITPSQAVLDADKSAK